jgi:hypothetical protein
MKQKISNLFYSYIENISVIHQMIKIKYKD